MRHVVRRMLPAALLLVAVVGLVPFFSRVFGFHSATVTNSTTGTYYPTTSQDSAAAPFIRCWQNPEPLRMRTAIFSTNNYIKCNNNWGTPVTITWANVAGGTATNITVSGSTLPIPAGVQNQCVRVTLAAFNATSGTLLIRGTITQSDLNAVIQVGAYFDAQSTNPATPQLCS